MFIKYGERMKGAVGEDEKENKERKKKEKKDNNGEKAFPFV